MWHKLVIFVAILGHVSVLTSAHLLPGLYCGEENCYDVINVTRASTKSEVSRNYRQLARKYHPDNRETGDELMFKRIANAYEILKDEEARRDYDYMLDHPEAYYQNYYRYYRRKGPKVDIRLVLFTTISVISLIQYFVRKSRYQEAVNYFVNVPKYRNKAMEMIASDKSLQDMKKEAKRSKLSKAELKEQQEKQIREIIEREDGHQRFLQQTKRHRRSLDPAHHFALHNNQIHPLVRSLDHQLQHSRKALWNGREALPVEKESRLRS